MLHARVDGFATSTVRHPSMAGRRIIVCTPVDNTGRVTGGPFLAIDTLGAGRHHRVLVTTDGSDLQQIVGDPKSPLRNHTVALVDAQ